MEDTMAFTLENRERILAVESTFPARRSLLEPGRILVGEGRLLKLCRRGPQPKAFYLFNDILIYGSIVVPGRWNNYQKIIPLEQVQQEDLEDGLRMANQWLLRTPRKSFYVAAASAEEKRTWMDHIENCRLQQLQRMGQCAAAMAGDFAATWIPDQASAICMRCSERFGITHRRHHCRHCGFVVCNGCSKERAMIQHISHKPVRVCRPCKNSLQGQQEVQENNRTQVRPRGKNWKGSSLESGASSEEETEELEMDQSPTQWFPNHSESWSPYCFLNPEHQRPPAAASMLKE